MDLQTWCLPLLSWKQDLSMTLWGFALTSLCRSLFRASAQSFECVKRSTEHFLWWWKLVRRERKSMLTMHLFKKYIYIYCCSCFHHDTNHWERENWPKEFKAHSLRNVPFPCFKYSLSLSFLLSDRRLLPVLNYAAGHVWKESSIGWEKKKKDGEEEKGRDKADRG